MLDGLEALHRLTITTRLPEVGQALDILRGVAAAMDAEIRKRYDMPPTA